MAAQRKECESAEQGRETPVPVGVGGGRPGSPRPSASDWSTPQVGNQAGVSGKSTRRAFGYTEDDNSTCTMDMNSTFEHRLVDPRDQDKGSD